MENKYKLLWLDDDFAEADAFQTKTENENRLIFQEDVEAASDWGFDVMGVKNLEEFKKEMANIGTYQAVVFDLRGMMAEESPDEYVAHDAIDILERTHKLPMYIYSGNTNMPQHEGMLRKFIKEGRVFNKSNGVDALYDKIEADLDDSLNFYEDHRECLQLFQRGFLDDMENRLVMDEIMRRHKEKDSTYSPYNAMRHILEDMLIKLSSKSDFIGLRRIEGNLKELLPFNRAVNYISRGYPLKPGATKEDKDSRDYNNPYIPFSVMRQDVKYVLSFLEDMTNSFSHYLDKNEGFLAKDESVRLYNGLMQSATYDAFFIVMRWYYNYMSRTQ